MHYTVCAYKELLLNVAAMEQVEDRCLNENAKIMKSKLSDMILLKTLVFNKTFSLSFLHARQHIIYARISRDSGHASNKI